METRWTKRPKLEHSIFKHRKSGGGKQNDERSIFKEIKRL